MPSVLELYQQNPYALWLGAAVLLVLVNLITGMGRLVWPTIAAVAVASVSLVGAHVDLPIEATIFVVLTIFFLLLPRKLNTAHSSYIADDEAHEVLEAKKTRRRKSKDERPVGAMDRTGRLVGRIGKTTGEFANGVGRVWIEGAEWGADLESGDYLHADTPVRVTRVNGGVRLQVRALNA
ncbi:hypothetical protein BH09PSE2_BH09PSE2_22750 [soil metagenome]